MYDIYTPMGSSVVTWLTCEASTSDREYYDYYFTNAYPNAEKIIVYNGLSSTRKFNCHGYAWLRVEQDIDRWIGYSDMTDENIYMTDGSYIEVSQAIYPGKVSWASGDHSAVTTGNPEWFISKWNQYPLFKHRWDDTPYGTTNLKYYVENCSVSSGDAVNFTNQIVGTNTIVVSCGDINVQNVTVTNGAKLTLDAVGKVNIISDFTVHLGSQLEIKDN
jgi:hypothetical protein